MDVFRITSLINFCVIIVFFGGKIIMGKMQGRRIIGVQNNKNKFMSALLLFSSVLWMVMWIFQIIDFKIVNRFLSLSSLIDSIALSVTGILFICAGTLFEICAGLVINESFRIHSPEEKEKTNLVTHGVYGVIRNPIVVGVFCYAFGIMLLNPGCLSLIMFTTVIISYNYKVDTEAEILEKRFGPKWRAYCEKTGKYFPKLFRAAHRIK